MRGPESVPELWGRRNVGLTFNQIPVLRQETWDLSDAPCDIPAQPAYCEVSLRQPCTGKATSPSTRVTSDHGLNNASVVVPGDAAPEYSGGGSREGSVHSWFCTCIRFRDQMRGLAGSVPYTVLVQRCVRTE
ncbi:hypothetical protein J6590_040232 [Homalodisca vitripennis]|nr:hypothetical protein J6590_040232 [Homalodisca vitripennis]